MKNFIVATVLAIFCGTVWELGGHLRKISDANFHVLTTPPLAELDTRVINVATLGHRGLYDDFINIWAIQFLFDERLMQEDPADIQKAILKITRHQPKLESLYIASCYLLLMEFNRGDLCEPIIIDGIKAFPQSWRIPITQGHISADSLKNFEKAALYYGMAASRPKAPEFLKRVAAKIITKNNLTPEDLNQLFNALVDSEEGSKLYDFFKELSERKNQLKQ